MQIDTAKNDDATTRTPGGINTAVIAVVGVIGVITLLVIVFAAEAWYYQLRDLEQQQTWSQPNPQVQAIRERDAMRLTQPHWRPVDPNNPDGAKAAVIPIDQAMEIIAKQSLQSAPR